MSIEQPLTVVRWLATVLRRGGIRQAFCVLSHYVGPLVNELSREEIHLVACSSETAAGYMADGSSRVTGRPGLVVCGGGPGLAMLHVALQTALMERIPLLAIVGQAPKDARPWFQDTGEEGSRDRQVLEGLLGCCHHVDNAATLVEILPSILQRLSQRLPVVITIPVDVQQDTIPEPPPDRPFPSHGDAVPASGQSPGHGIPPPHPSDLSYLTLLGTLVRGMPWTTPLFVCAGQSRHAARQLLVPMARRFHDCPRSAPMGWAVAAAMGAALSFPDQGAVCVMGDGSALMLAGELATAVRYNAAITILILANGVLGNPYGRHRDTGAQHLAVLPDIDWVRLAEAMGLPAAKVATAAEMTAALAETTGTPRLLVASVLPVDSDVRPPYPTVDRLVRLSQSSSSQ